ncbi:hypothetical protein QN277_010646 [Acacia crassicarpa]|uniref:F-box domain-containing protein n=1 Tax=Acacia crassicarpa TaxID=499986 RepID=A0AAE1IN08_9FABA|nr:hypothetical protein QN277_010646 [Acacia crassicarpa]
MFGDLPPEVLVDILHRLPFKSLMKCTNVCKDWNSLITDQTFIFDHLNQTIQASKGNGWLFLQLYLEMGARIQDIHYEEFYSLYSHNHYEEFFADRFPPSSILHSYDHSTVVGTCNGLVCITGDPMHDIATFLIWNPSIRKYMVISEPILTSGAGNGQHEEYQFSLYGFGFDSKNKDYKVIRLVTLLSKENVPQVEVFSLASRSWRSIPFIASPFLLPELLWNIPQVFFNGVLHWVVSRRCDDRILNFILTFDVVEETFGELTLPQHLRESTSKLSILQGEDSLCVLHAYHVEDDLFFSIWVMKEYGVVGSWNEVYSWDSHLYEGIFTVLALCADGKVVLLLDSGDVVLLDPVTQLVKSLTDLKWLNAFAGFYVESLVFIKREPDVLSY